MSEKSGGDDPTLNPEAPLKPKPGIIGWLVGRLSPRDISPQHIEEYQKMPGVNVENTSRGIEVSVHTMVPPEQKKKE